MQKHKRITLRMAAGGILCLLGIGLMGYPLISGWLQAAAQGEVIRSYQSDVMSLSEAQRRRAWQEAVAYNEALLQLVQKENATAEEFQQQNLTYDQLLNENADGVMSYIEIPTIEVYLPIYHGATDDVLKRGVGHLINTSLPVGGPSTHCVISAHRGDPSAALFTHLDQLQIGDEFQLYTLGEKLTYRVDQIKTVRPYETDDFQITVGQDYVTLVTCTPYGINTHRLLVRGKRVTDET